MRAITATAVEPGRSFPLVASLIAGRMLMNTEAIATRLVKLCREGKFEEAQRELYAADAVSIEAEGAPPGALGNVKGEEAIFEKKRQFNAGVEQMHGISMSDPLIAGNWFTAVLTLDATMKGRGRVNLTEICVYRVRDGKIAHEQFFYDVG
jgi:ketosteroid isomerase-like protein